MAAFQRIRHDEARMKFSARSLSALALAAASMLVFPPHALAKPGNAQKCGDAATAPSTTTEILKTPVEPGLHDLNVVGPLTCTVTGKTLKYGAVKIKNGGTLIFSDDNVVFEAESIVVETGGTMMTEGGIAAPVGSKSKGSLKANQVIIRLTGDRPIPPVKHVSTDDCSVVEKGIGVMSGGTLRLFGAKGVPSRGGVSWTHLSAPAGPTTYEDADKSKRIGAPVAPGQDGLRLQLEKSVTAGDHPWQPGDWIVIATTSYSPFESEFAEIATVNGTEITLKTKLKHYHFGGPDPGAAVDNPQFGAGTPSESFKAGKDKNYGVDERAEVGLISRNVVLTADTSNAFDTWNALTPDPKRNWGGETKFCSGFKDVALEGVEIEKFGKEALGSYPIHLHMAGDVSGKIQVVANSAHHSYNKCVAIHMTSNAAFEDNVCARITGHIFYEEIGDEANITFKRNLALGAMNNNFGLASDPKSTPGYWEGDNKAVALGFTGLGIANTDSQGNPVHGTCLYADNRSGLLNSPAGASCSPGDGAYYTEPPTGFWIINPTAILEGNSVAGCQGQGRGYWYLASLSTKFLPIGMFRNNRAHGCYDGIFGEPEAPVDSAQQLFPTTTADNAGENLIARFEGFTASRIRNRAVWMRPMWNVFENARIATSREGVALVTSGGPDGNAPGVWGLLKHAVVVGVSTNNVDRWGPCAGAADLGSYVEFKGCVDFNNNSKELEGKGYPGPGWNFAGFYIYDGPIRIHDTRFVRFQVDPSLLLTTADAATLATFMPKASRPYEGDAALGWFAANPSQYPSSTEVKALTFEETSLRHQIFTERVNLSSFTDGDMNTAVIDRDGSLTGFRVLGPEGNHPISLNNLPFNAVSNAVDECHSEGAQDTIQEGRPTSLISPANMATLEFGALQLPDGLSAGGGQVSNQSMTFVRDSPDHQTMVLKGRNSQGVWEPKVASGLGYTVRASNGIPKVISVGLTDAVKPKMNEDPFYVRVGVCYSDSKTGVRPDAKFKVSRGYKSWGGNGVNYNAPKIRRYFNRLHALYQGEICHDLDAQPRDPGDLSQNLKANGCPAHGVVIADGLVVGGKCPDGSAPEMAGGEQSCIYKPSELSEGTFEQLAPGGKPDVTKYHYDKTTGMLFFYVVQNEANAHASSPIGSCVSGTDPACPDKDESFYGCPAQGCTTYKIEITDSDYSFGPSQCGGAGAADLYAKVPKFVLPEPANANKLGYVQPGTAGEVIAQNLQSAQGFPHRAAMTPPVCTGTP